MTRPITSARFEKEPQGLRSNAGSNLVRNGEGGITLAYDDATAMVHIIRKRNDAVQEFAVHGSRFEWIEFAEREQDTPKKPDAAKK